nr:ribonuclease P protein component [Treponemataceae bacterium]
MGTGLVKTGRFRREEHLKRPTDIKMLFKTGKKVSTKGAKLYYQENQLGINRIAFTLPRGYGNAVQRNKSKRL